LQANAVGAASPHGAAPGPNAAEYEAVYRRYISLFPRVARPPALD
jgi:hypothetical protein